MGWTGERLKSYGREQGAKPKAEPARGKDVAGRAL